MFCASLHVVSNFAFIDLCIFVSLCMHAVCAALSTRFSSYHRISCYTLLVYFYLNFSCNLLILVNTFIVNVLIIKGYILYFSVHPLPSLLPYTSIFEICKGHVADLDLVSMEIQLPDNSVTISYGTLGTMLGLIADIDIESETMRCFGQSFRTTLYAILRIATMREYEMSISYLPAEDNEQNMAQQNPAFDSSMESTSFQSGDDTKTPTLHTANVSSGDVLSEDWVTTNDSYISVQGLAISHISSEHIMFPDIRLSSGYMKIALLKTKSRSKIFKTWDELEDGTGFLSAGRSHSTVIPCSAFRITPARKQIITLDGEVMPYGVIHCKIHKSMARVLTHRSRNSS